MGTVPTASYQFIINYAPYFYYIPGSGVDPEFGRGVAPAAFAMDFLYEAYQDEQFESQMTEIYNKIVSLADFVLTQQCSDPAKKAYGGFKSNETSNYYYSVDACRVIPSLLKAYELTNDADYLNAAVLAGKIFLKTMQDEQTYGGFARAVDINDNWLLQMDMECLYGLIGLKMLCSYDSANQSQYASMMEEAVGFLQEGFENLWLHYDPSDDEWHRVGLSENEIYDDPFAYALIGLYDYEGWSLTCEKVYEFINTIPASADYPGYNSNICWAGYIDVVARKAACDYYDGVTSGILHGIRAAKDKPSLELSVQIVNLYVSEFMFWGVKFLDWSPVENKQSTITVSWLSLLLLNYEPVQTRFTQILWQAGENLTLYSVVQSEGQTSYLEGINVRAIVRLLRSDELVIEPGYALTDFIMIYTLLPVRQRDKIRRYGVDYEVGPVELFRFRGEPYYYRALCRRLIG
jgi:hypothetical protein